MPLSAARVRACGAIARAAMIPRTGLRGRVAVEEFQVAGQLLDGVDVGLALDFHRNVFRRMLSLAIRLSATLTSTATAPVAFLQSRSTGPIGVGCSCRRTRQARRQSLRMFGEKLLEMCLNAVLLEPGVDAEFMGEPKTSPSQI